MLFARRALAAVLALALPLAENPAWGASKSAPPAPPAAAALPTLPTTSALPALPSAASIPASPAAPSLNPGAALKAAAQNAVAPETVEAIAHGREAPAELQAGLGAELEADLASGQLGFVRREGGAWKLVFGDAAGHAANVLAAVREIEASGIPLPATQEILILPDSRVQSARAVRSALPRAVLGADSIAKLSAPPVSRGGKPSDGIVQSLLIVTLTGGLPAPMRLSVKEVVKAGLILNPYLGGQEAIALFKRTWLKHVGRLTAKLPEAFPYQGGVATAMGWPSSVVDPQTGSVISVDRVTGRLEVRRLGLDGILTTEVLQNSPLQKHVTRVSFDASSRTFWLWGHRDYGRARVDAKGMVEPPQWRAYPQDLFAPQVKAHDPRTGRLLVGEGLEHELREILPDGSLSQPLQRLGWKAFGALTAVFDPVSGVLISGASGGRLEARAPGDGGRLSESPVQSLSLGEGLSVIKLALDPRQRVLYAAVSDGKANWLEARSVTAEGRITEEPFDAIRVGLPQHFDLAVDPFGGTVLVGVAGALLVYRLSARRGARFLEAISPAAVQAVAAAAARASKRELGPIVQAMNGSVESGGFAPWLHGLWQRLSSELVLGRGLPGTLRRIPGGARWFGGAEAELKERMPLLWRLLREPSRLAGLLTALSLLRMGIPFHMANRSPVPPLRWSQDHGLSFGLGGMLVSPVSESFRRHIFSVEDDKGALAVELKLPGEEKGRESIFPEHFDAAKELWEKNPADPGVVEPLFYGQYRGKIRLYGKDLSYGTEGPLGLMLFRYEDGKRLRNVGAIPDRYAAQGLDAKTLITRARADAAAAAIRLHRLGWKGHAAGGNDMHDENVRIFPDGRAVLVGDFGAFERAPLAWGERALETLMLIGLDPLQHRGLLEELEPLVVERLSRGATEPAEIESLRDEVRRELGLANP